MNAVPPVEHLGCDHVVGVFWEHADTTMVWQSGLQRYVDSDQRMHQRRLDNKAYINADTLAQVAEAKTPLQLFEAFGNNAFTYCPDCGKDLREVFKPD